MWRYLFGGRNNPPTHDDRTPRVSPSPPPRRGNDDIPSQIPRASKNFLENLPHITVTNDDLMADLNNKECVICFEEHNIGSLACKLPCYHIFHPDCLRGWLNKQASCPICRYEIETDDIQFEIMRKKRMRDRKIRYRKDELIAKPIKELQKILALYSLSSRGCVDKRDMVELLISSGKVDVMEGVPTLEMTRSDLEMLSVSEVKKLLIGFGLTQSEQYQNALEKRDLIECLVASNRIRLIVERKENTKDDTSCRAAFSEDESKYDTLADSVFPAECPLALYDMKDLLGTARALGINVEIYSERAEIVNAIRGHPEFENQL